MHEYKVVVNYTIKYNTFLWCFFYPFLSLTVIVAINCHFKLSLHSMLIHTGYIRPKSQ